MTTCRGLAVHIATRLLGEAGKRIVVSGTTRDLATGSGLRFIDLGEHELRGVPGSWRMFEVVEGG